MITRFPEISLPRYTTHRRRSLQVKTLLGNRKLCFYSFRNRELSKLLTGKLKRSRFLPVCIDGGGACRGNNHEETGWKVKENR